MGAYLFIRSGASSGEVHPIAEDVVVVGRGRECSVPLADARLSRRHFQVERARGAYWLVDLGSKNGTLLNGVPVGRCELARGDEILAGSTRLLFVTGRPAVGARAAEDEARTVTELAGAHEGAPEMLGSSEVMRPVFAAIESAARSDATVLVTGETGSGKELVARAIHRSGCRSASPLVTVNCAAIPRDLVESELFGHEPGAFTGAQARRLGKLELAHGGTLFLDEIGDLAIDAQAKILRALEERRIVRVGGDREIAVNVRVVAATHRDLRAMAREERFRRDLLYRLEVLRIDVPPLRERRGDIPLLARRFLDLRREHVRGPALTLAAGALDALRAHDWPGNVRELRNVIDRAVAFATGPRIEASDLGLAAAAAVSAKPPREARGEEGIVPIGEALGREVERAVTLAGGNKARAARLLGMARSTLYLHLARLARRGKGRGARRA